MKTRITENRDSRVRESRLEIRLTKVERDALTTLAQKKNTTITNLIVTALISPKSKR
jgi:uncharacterized protein (DUF1778 family)